MHFRVSCNSINLFQIALNVLFGGLPRTVGKMAKTATDELRNRNDGVGEEEVQPRILGVVLTSRKFKSLADRLKTPSGLSFYKENDWLRCAD